MPPGWQHNCIRLTPILYSAGLFLVQVLFLTDALSDVAPSLAVPRLLPVYWGGSPCSMFILLLLATCRLFARKLF